MKVPCTSSLSVYTKVLAHNLNDIRNWASLIGLLLRICWCLLSVFLIYCSDEWKKLVNLIYCFQVLFRMNFKIMYFLMKILGNTPSADSAASRDSLSSQNATWGIVFFSSFYWWHIEYKGWMCERLLNLQEIYVSGQNICIVVYGNSVGTITPYVSIIMAACFSYLFLSLDTHNDFISGYTETHQLAVILNGKQTITYKSSVRSQNIEEHLSRIVTKPIKWHVRPAKTQISLGIRPFWSESSLSAWIKLGSLATY